MGFFLESGGCEYSHYQNPCKLVKIGLFCYKNFHAIPIYFQMNRKRENRSKKANKFKKSIFD
jgi:hypothetical protein